MQDRGPERELLLAEVLAAETAVWRALTQGDAAADRALLSHDFLGVYPSGFAGREEHAEQLRDGPAIAAFTLSGARLLSPAPGVALLSYRADFRRSGPQREEEAVFVSSLWRHENGAWINLFSQDTPLSPMS